jgi:hypothetical protein
MSRSKTPIYVVDWTLKRDSIEILEVTVNVLWQGSLVGTSHHTGGIIHFIAVTSALFVVSASHVVAVAPRLGGIAVHAMSMATSHILTTSHTLATSHNHDHHPYHDHRPYHDDHRICP